MTCSGPQLEGGSLLRIQTLGTPSAIWIELEGEADVSNRDQLRAALFAPDLGQPRRVTLDLRGLNFCDVACCRLLLLFSEEAQLYGHDVTFLGPTPGVRKVLDLLAPRDGPVFM